jgi:hypothetical protein
MLKKSLKLGLKRGVVPTLVKYGIRLAVLVGACFFWVSSGNQGDNLQQHAAP